jgi:hypothetical protein
LLEKGESKAVAQIALFIALNVGIWSRNIEMIDDACYKLGQKGYTAYPVFVLADRFPLWSFKRVGIE